MRRIQEATTRIGVGVGDINSCGSEAIYEAANQK